MVVDDTGDVTGIKGNILEKHVDLSKASDAVSNVNAPQKTYFKDYLRDLSANIYAGKDPLAAADAHHGTTPVATGFTAYTGVHLHLSLQILEHQPVWNDCTRQTVPCYR